MSALMIDGLYIRNVVFLIESEFKFGVCVRESWKQDNKRENMKDFYESYGVVRIRSSLMIMDCIC